VVNGALASASTDARLVQTAIAGHVLDRGGGTPTVRRRRPADSGLLHHGSPQHGRAIEWANKLPTYGYVEVGELLQF